MPRPSLRPVPRAASPQPLTSPLVLQLRDGSLVRIAPGPYGKGIAVVPILPRAAAGNGRRGRRAASDGPREPGKRGRKPRPSTVKLREKLEKDHKGGKILEPPAYVKWLINEDEEVGLPMARTVVYRELKKYR
jgi:hypothetical protein